jgi:hypothetical protein
MHDLIAKDARNKQRIAPYIGGEELNDTPTQLHTRYVINFGQISLADAEQWPDLLDIVRAKVKPDRDRLREDTGPGAHGKKWWWQYQHPRQELYEAIAGLNRVLVLSRVGQHGAFSFLPAGMVYSEAVIVFARDSYTLFFALQSRPHEIWARFFASSLEERLRYTASDCFETFPFPEAFESNAPLESAGQTYYEFRAALMVRNNEGLTKTYNRFHGPNESSPDILKLRQLHEAMDRAVLDAYGWSDVPTRCEFLLDYEEDEDEEDVRASGRGRRKPSVSRTGSGRAPCPRGSGIRSRLSGAGTARACSTRASGCGCRSITPACSSRGTSPTTSRTGPVDRGGDRRTGDELGGENLRCVSTPRVHF